MRRATAITLVALATITIAGCASAAAPTQDELTERFAAEIRDTFPSNANEDDVQELAASLAEDAPDECNDLSYWSLADDWQPELRTVWATTCNDLYNIDPQLKDEYEAVIEGN